MKKVLPLLFLFGIFSSMSFLAQAKAGEIININYKYKIAFADLTESQVQVGDKVGIKLSDGSSVYLEAVETYPVMVKLSVAKEPAYSLSDAEFAKITVGAQAMLLDQANILPTKRLAGKPTSGTAANNKSSEEWDDPQGSPIEVFQPKAMSRGAASQQQAPASVARPAIVEEDVTSSVVARADNVQGKVQELVEANMRLSGNLSRVLDEKAALENILKEKEAELTEARKRALDAVELNQPLQSKVDTLTASISTLNADKAALEKDVADLNVKMVELKKKLERMVEIVNKNIEKL